MCDMKKCRKIKANGYFLGGFTLPSLGGSSGANLVGGAMDTASSFIPSSGNAKTDAITNGVASGLETVGSAFGPLGSVIGKAAGMLTKGIGAMVGTADTVDDKTGEYTKGKGIKGRKSRQKMHEKWNRVNQGISDQQMTSQLQEEYANEHGNNTYSLAAEGGTIPTTLAYLDDGELYRTPQGMIDDIPEKGRPTDSNLVNVPVGTQVLSDKLKVPGTKKTFAQVGKELMKERKSKGNDIYAQNSDMLNNLNNQKKFDELIQLQEQVKKQRRLRKLKQLGIPGYAMGGQMGMYQQQNMNQYGTMQPQIPGFGAQQPMGGMQMSGGQPMGGQQPGQPMGQSQQPMGGQQPMNQPGQQPQQQAPQQQPAGQQPATDPNQQQAGQQPAADPNAQTGQQPVQDPNAQAQQATDPNAQAMTDPNQQQVDPNAAPADTDQQQQSGGGIGGMLGGMLGGMMPSMCYGGTVRRLRRIPGYDEGTGGVRNVVSDPALSWLNDIYGTSGYNEALAGLTLGNISAANQMQQQHYGFNKGQMPKGTIIADPEVGKYQTAFQKAYPQINQEIAAMEKSGRIKGRGGTKDNAAGGYAADNLYGDKTAMRYLGANLSDEQLAAVNEQLGKRGIEAYMDPNYGGYVMFRPSAGQAAGIPISTNGMTLDKIDLPDDVKRAAQAQSRAQASEGNDDGNGNGWNLGLADILGNLGNLAGPIANIYDSRAESSPVRTWTPHYGPVGYDVNPLIRQANLTNAINRYNINKAGGAGRGANLAQAVQMGVARNNAIANAYATKNNVENSQRTANAQIWNDWAKDNADRWHTADDENAQNRAAARNLRRTGIAQLGTALASANRDRRLSNRDAAVLEYMRPYLQYGSTRQAVENLFNMLPG